MTQLEKDEMIWDLVMEHYSNKYNLKEWYTILEDTNADRMMKKLGMSAEYLEEAFMDI
jgi:hypothetical protein